MYIPCALCNHTPDKCRPVRYTAAVAVGWVCFDEAVAWVHYAAAGVAWEHYDDAGAVAVVCCNDADTAVAVVRYNDAAVAWVHYNKSEG